MAIVLAVEPGSFLALLSYPFLIEPFLRLRTQVNIWSALYVAFAVLCGWTAWQLRGVTIAAPSSPGENRGGSADGTGAEGAPGLSHWDVLFWLGLSICSSVLLLATTNQVSQEIAVVPFLWSRRYRSIC